jgi:hypothetical protein
MKYRVEYHPDGWRRIAPRHPYAPSHDDFGAVQMVQQDIDDRTRLCVELMRKEDGSITVTVARLEVWGNYRGRERYRTARFLQPAELELVTVETTVPS